MRLAYGWADASDDSDVKPDDTKSIDAKHDDRTSVAAIATGQEWSWQDMKVVYNQSPSSLMPK